MNRTVDRGRVNSEIKQSCKSIFHRDQPRDLRAACPHGFWKNKNNCSSSVNKWRHTRQQETALMLPKKEHHRHRTLVSVGPPIREGIIINPTRLVLSTANSCVKGDTNVSSSRWQRSNALLVAKVRVRVKGVL